VIAVAAAAPAFWLRLVYGDAYDDYAYLVWWWAVSYSIGFAAGLANVGLRAMEETKPIFIAFLVSSAVAVATVYPVVNLLGVVGVILGYILHEAIRLVCLYPVLLRGGRARA